MPAYNMGFSAMLADEYIFNCINFTEQQFRLTNHRISAQQKALDVVRHFYGNVLIMHLQKMTHRLTCFLFSLFLCLTNVVFGQTPKNEQKLKSYLEQQRMLGVDSFFVIKSGCTGCEVKYNDTSKAISDGQTIYVLTKYRGQFRIVSIDDFSREKTYSIDSCTLFDTVQLKKQVLRQKEVFYKKEHAESKKVKFYPPRPTHYSYNEITIMLHAFTYNFKLVENEYDYLGFSRKSEEWFDATKNIINQFFIIYKSVGG